MREDFDPCFRMGTHICALDQGAFFALLMNKARTAESLPEGQEGVMCLLNRQVKILLSLDA